MFPLYTAQGKEKSPYEVGVPIIKELVTVTSLFRRFEHSRLVFFYFGLLNLATLGWSRTTFLRS